MSDSPNTPSFLPPADLAKELSAPDSGSPGDESIRPSRLEDFIGQEELRANLRVFLNAARERGQAMDHVLFYGNPGLGKPLFPAVFPETDFQCRRANTHFAEH